MIKVTDSIRRIMSGGKGKSIKILIDNFGFKNRGDHLMIQSVLDQIRLHRPEAQVFVRRNVFLENPSYCINNCIYPLQLSNSGIKHSHLYAKMVNSLLCDEWIVMPNQIDVVLDCCGYYITDAWHKTESDYRNVKNYYALFSNPKLKVIYLPQAFGPFGNEWSQRVAYLAYDRATRIYAREASSFQYLKDLIGKTDKLSIAPDFTCFCQTSKKPTIQLSPKQYVLIIPNGNMIGQTEKNVADNYILFLRDITEYLIGRRENVYLLNHEGEEDEQLLHSINELLPQPLPILTNMSGQDIKAIIKDAKLVISARFHGVVSALTQHVPTLCSSWSHKYAELLKEHGCEESMLEVGDVEESFLKISQALEHPDRFISKEGCEGKIENEVRSMWNEIFEMI